MMDDIFVTDKTSIYVFEETKLVGTYTKETGVPKILIEEDYVFDEDGLDKELARNRNRDIELEVRELREILDYNDTKLKPERVKEIDEEIEKLLRERDDNTFKYGLAGEKFNRIYKNKFLVDSEEWLNDNDITITPEVNGDSRFRFITEEMVTLYSQKNADYGDAFTESLDEDGLLVSKIRLKDKLNRFSQLINNDALVNDESMRDTLIDMANYAVMTMMWIDDNE